MNCRSPPSLLRSVPVSSRQEIVPIAASEAGPGALDTPTIDYAQCLQDGRLNDLNLACLRGGLRLLPR